MTIELCLLTTSVYIGASLWNSSIPGVVKVLGADRTVAELGKTLLRTLARLELTCTGTSLYLFGLAIGGMIFSPIGEIPQIGKNHVYIPTVVLYILLQLPILLSNNMAVILVFRFLTGMLASPTLSLGGGSVADLWSSRLLGYPMVTYDGATAFGTFCGKSHLVECTR